MAKKPVTIAEAAKVVPIKPKAAKKPYQSVFDMPALKPKTKR